MEVKKYSYIRESDDGVMNVCDSASADVESSPVELFLAVISNTFFRWPKRYATVILIVSDEFWRDNKNSGVTAKGQTIRLDHEIKTTYGKVARNASYNIIVFIHRPIRWSPGRRGLQSDGFEKK